MQAGEGYGSGFAFLPDGRMIGALGRDRLGIWSARGKREDSLQTDDWVRSVCAAPDGRRIAARLSGGGVLVWSDGERIGEHEASLLARGIAFAGETLVTGDDAALMTWGGGVPEPDPALFVPTFRARFARRSATPLLAAVESIPWLAHADLDAWPGPEDPAVAALNRYEVELAAPVERAIRGLHRDDVRAHAEEIGARVRSAAPYEATEDPWHPPTASVEIAGYVAETLAGYVGLGWPVPDDLLTLWAWYEEGRWPGAVRDGALVVY